MMTALIHKKADLKSRFKFIDYLRTMRLTKPRLQFEEKEAKFEITRRVSKEERDFVTGPNFTLTNIWIRLRYDALEAKVHICKSCQSDGGRGGLNVDHKRNRRDFPELALLYSNFQLLCPPCNQGKGNRFNTDWEKRRPERDRESDYIPSDDVRAEFEALSPGWDRDKLLSEYRRFQRKRGENVHSPDKAFLGWVRKVTKGSPPPATRRACQASPKVILMAGTTKRRRPFGKPKKPR